jgi:hypothetical protein
MAARSPKLTGSRFRAVVVRLSIETLFGFLLPRRAAEARARRRALRPILRTLAFDYLFWYVTTGRRQLRLASHGYGGPEVLSEVMSSLERTAAERSAQIDYVPRQTTLAVPGLPALVVGSRIGSESPADQDGSIELALRTPGDSSVPSGRTLVRPDPNTSNVLDQDDPFWLWELTFSSQSATLEGLEDYRGTLCRRYLLTVNFDVAAARSAYALMRPVEAPMRGFDEILLEIWIGRDGLVRAIKLHRERSAMLLSFSGFGAGIGLVDLHSKRSDAPSR